MAKPSLLSLPAELQLGIIDLLPIPTLQNLAAVHPYFRNIIDLDATRAAAHSADLFHQYQTANTTYRLDPDHKVCCECIRLRPKTKFTTSLTSDRRSPANLFCEDCGVFRRQAPEAWCKKCDAAGFNRDRSSGRRCVRNRELKQTEGFVVPNVEEMLLPDGTLPAIDECPMSWRERWCLRDEWAMSWGCS